MDWDICLFMRKLNSAITLKTKAKTTIARPTELTTTASNSGQLSTCVMLCGERAIKV